jgi:hypothetical protein
MIGVVATVVQKVEAAEYAVQDAAEENAVASDPGEQPSSSDGTAIAPKRDSSRRPVQNDHRGQTGLALMPGTGFRVIVPYEENIACGDSSGNRDKPVCTRRSPTFLDLQLSFAPSRRIDIIFDVRFGLTSDPASAGSHQFALMPGLRFWLDQDVALKFYTTVQLAYDQTDYGGTVSSGDFGFRNANGLMYDPLRNVGFFIQLGETIGFVRWFHMDLDLGLGVQIRFP